MKYDTLIRERPGIFYNVGAPLKIILDRAEIAEWERAKRRALEAQGRPGEWANIGIVYEDPYIVILRDLVEFPDGSRNGYSRFFNRASLEDGAAGVVVLPQLNERLLLLEQFRHATRAWHLEIPRGFGEPNTAAEEQARNEIREEIGGVIDEIVPLGILHNNTGMEGNSVHLFFAKLKSVGGASENEGIRSYRWVSLSQLEKMIADEEITDSFTIVAYARAKLRNLLG